MMTILLYLLVPENWFNGVMKQGRLFKESNHQYLPLLGKTWKFQENLYLSLVGMRGIQMIEQYTSMINSQVFEVIS